MKYKKTHGFNVVESFYPSTRTLYFI